MSNSQISAQIIKDRAKEKEITLKKMLEDCGLSRNALSSMQSGGYMPRVENLCKLADYLECSVDYLLGRTDTPTANNINNISGNNNNGSNTITVGKSEEETDSTTDEFFQAFKSMELPDRVEVMKFAFDKMRKGA